MSTEQHISCFGCGETEESSITEFYGYTVCKACQVKLGLFQDETIKKHVDSFQRANQRDPNKPLYQEEVRNRLVLLDKDYLPKRIKLLHIQSRLKEV